MDDRSTPLGPGVAYFELPVGEVVSVSEYVIPDVLPGRGLDESVDVHPGKPFTQFANHRLQLVVIGHTKPDCQSAIPCNVPCDGTGELTEAFTWTVHAIVVSKPVPNRGTVWETRRQISLEVTGSIHRRLGHARFAIGWTDVCRHRVDRSPRTRREFDDRAHSRDLEPHLGVECWLGLAGIVVSLYFRTSSAQIVRVEPVEPIATSSRRRSGRPASTGPLGSSGVDSNLPSPPTRTFEPVVAAAAVVDISLEGSRPTVATALPVRLSR